MALAVLAAYGRVGPARVYPLASLGLLTVYAIGSPAFASTYQEVMIYDKLLLIHD